MLRSTSLLLVALAACGDSSLPGPDAGPSGPWTGARLGGPGDDDVLDLHATGDALYVAGYRNGLLGFENIQPIGDAVGFVAVLGLDGAPRGEVVLDTAGADTVEAIDVTAADLAVAGRTSGAFAGAVNAGQMDAYVARVPLEGGAPVSAPVSEPVIVQFGDARPQHPARIARDAAGGLLVAGYDDTYVEGSAVVDAENPITARVRGDLTLDWYRRDTTPTSDVYYGLAAPGPAGELIVSGLVLTGASSGPFVRRLDATGAPMWTRRLSAVGADVVTALAFGPGGKLYAAGTTFVQLGARAYGEQDMFVAVIDPATGVVERAMQAGCAASDYARDLAVAPDGTVYVVGETLCSLPGATLAGVYDLALVRFAPDGTWTGAWQRGSAGDESLSAVAIGPDALYVAGHAYDAPWLDAPPLGRRDGFVQRVPLSELVRP